MLPISKTSDDDVEFVYVASAIRAPICEPLQPPVQVLPATRLRTGEPSALNGGNHAEIDEVIVALLLTLTIRFISSTRLSYLEHRREIIEF